MDTGSCSKYLTYRWVEQKKALMWFITPHQTEHTLHLQHLGWTKRTSVQVRVYGKCIFPRNRWSVCAGKREQFLQALLRDGSWSNLQSYVECLLLEGKFLLEFRGCSAAPVDVKPWRSFSWQLHLVSSLSCLLKRTRVSSHLGYFNLLSSLIHCVDVMCCLGEGREEIQRESPHQMTHFSSLTHTHTHTHRNCIFISVKVFHTPNYTLVPFPSPSFWLIRRCTCRRGIE